MNKPIVMESESRNALITYVGEALSLAYGQPYKDLEMILDQILATGVVPTEARLQRAFQNYFSGASKKDSQGA